MEKIDFTKQFSLRLRDAMIAAGFNSQRSTSGVCIHKLAEITGHSLQICRKYLRGDTIPDPLKLVAIARKLNVSAGWLLFGDNETNKMLDGSSITISKSLLHYIFSQASTLYKHSLGDDPGDFLLDLIDNISQIQATEEQSKKIIDLALTSTKHFRN